MLTRRYPGRTTAAVGAAVCTLSAWLALAAEPSFRCRPINSQSTYAACAAVDVNRDGRLDIVCGGWWYEAPSWERRFLREVQMIGGRYDDYANLPLDVNGDGRLDVISANYRSQSLYWVEHPAQAGQPWAKHIIDVPGPMETGRLVDVDQDGQLDVLPSGTTFAAWWELVRPVPSSATESSQWVRHELPAEAVAHGLGFGDIDGDGRGDIVTPRGWLQAPADRRRGGWIWHDQYDLDRDCSVPIVVHDADADGDNDLIWGRGHGTGLYWMEQVRGSGDSRQWVRHAIDTSWSQPHSLLLADLDGDGQVELIAGKRFLGHDGKDLGEWDPLAIYWYDFDPLLRVWRRGTICQGGPVGFGLDPKSVDLDADGDVDILAPGRSGLFWLENLLISQPVTGPSPSAPPALPRIRATPSRTTGS